MRLHSEGAVIRAEDDSVVAVMAMQPGEREKEKSYGAFLVRACNSHEALVALAEYALSQDMLGGFVIPNEIAFRAREALAKP